MRMIKIVNQFYVFILLLFISTELFAFDPQVRIQQGNKYYSENNFEKAAAEYKTVLDSGFVSAELYYNLGNVYFKLANYKKAILYYEKAKLLKPGDDDIDFNLELARSFTIDKIEAIPELFFITWFKVIRNTMSATMWAFISIGSFIISLIAFLFYLLSGRIFLKKIGFWVGIILLLASAGAFGFGNSLKQLQVNQNTAIIFTPSVSIKSTPSESGTSLFVLHEGTKVEIIDTTGAWCEIKIASGNRGWIKINDLEKI
jgi:tetratricopeptide (TPR) repeat protein